MELRIASTRIHVHPLMILLSILSFALGMASRTAALLLSLSIHELSHMAAARAIGIRISRIHLMPFGGAARLANPYALSPIGIFLTAAAGPFSNFAVIIFCGAMAHWRMISPGFSLLMLRTNLLLMLFNLLPALPLDGGRMLYAILSKPLGRSKALDIGIIIGRVIAVALILAGIYAWLIHGALNLSMIFAGIFIIASAPDERRALGDVRIQTILNEMQPLYSPFPAKIFAIGSACPVQEALKRAVPDAVTLYAVYDNFHLLGFADDRQVLNLLWKKDHLAPVGEALRGNQKGVASL